MKTIWKRVFEKADQDDIVTHSAALAFYMESALVPLCVLVVSMLANLQYDILDQVIEKIQTFVGNEVAQIFASVASGAKKREDLKSWSGLIAFFTLLISTGVIFAKMESAFALILKKDHQRNSEQNVILSFIKYKIVSAAMVFSFVILTFVSVSVSAKDHTLPKYRNFYGFVFCAW